MRAIDKTIIYSNVTTSLCTVMAIYFMLRTAFDLYLYFLLR